MSDLTENAIEKALLSIREFANNAGLAVKCRPTKILISRDPLHKENEYSLIERSYLYWCHCGECRFHLILQSSLRYPSIDLSLFRIVTKNGRFPNKWMNRKQINKDYFIKKKKKERAAYRGLYKNLTQEDDGFGLDGEWYE